MCYFKDIQDTSTFDVTNHVHVECLRYCFMEVIQTELDRIVLHWNLHDIRVTRWTKQAFPCSKFLSPGVSFGQIQHLRGLNSIALGYLNFTAGLT